MYKLTKIGADGAALPDDVAGHEVVRIEHELLARPIIATAFRSPRLSWKDAKAWAASLDTYGWSWRLPEVQEAFFFPDFTRTSWPLTPKEHFPDCEGEMIWTATEDLSPPSGCARVVGLGFGRSSVGHQLDEFFARAVRAGQRIGLSVGQ